MMEYIVKCRAKINLSLDIVSKREDGYHNLKMIMHTVNLYDTLLFKQNTTGKISITTNLKYLPCDQKNIVFKAYEKFYENASISPQGFHVKIKKDIPVSAGLAGGSSDAAATLLFLNEFHKYPLSLEELLRIGKQLGADVPYCILGETYLAEGIGEKLTKMNPLPPCHIVIAKPQNKGLSTKKIFSMVNLSDIKYHPDTQGIIQALEAKDLNGVCLRLYNVLEDYSISECNEISSYKSMFIECGALGSLMSGSGNAVFGIFDDFDKAKIAYDKFKKITSFAFMV